MAELIADIRLMMPSDLREVVTLERACFAEPWKFRHFRRIFREPHLSAWVAVMRQNGLPMPTGIVGYVVTEIHADHLEVVSMAVAETWRGRGVGRGLLEAPRFAGSRLPMAFELWERQLDLQRFARSCGFKCVRTTRGSFEVEGGREDGYWFERPAARVEEYVEPVIGGLGRRYG